MVAERIIRLALLGLTALLLSRSSYAHEPEPAKGADALRTSLSLGFLIGGSFSPNQYSYRSGLSARLGVEYTLSRTVALGPTVGYNQQNDEYFIPLGIGAFFHPRPSGVGFYAEAGYAFARTRLEDINLAYDLDGSGYITLGSRWNFPIGKGIEIQPAVLMTIHRTETEFTQDIGQPISVDEDRISILCHLGIAF